jgi:20S proteasome alpha/beta subunit
MTTIATDGKVIAADSRTTYGNIVATEKCKKIFEYKDGSVVGCGGNRGEIRDFKKWCQNGRIDSERPELEDFFAVELTPSGKLYGYDNSCTRIKVEPPFAAGTGGDIALGAMLSGKSPKEAVELAIKKDIYSGGKVLIKAACKKKRKQQNSNK